MKAPSINAFPEAGVTKTFSGTPRRTRCPNTSKSELLTLIPAPTVIVAKKKKIKIEETHPCPWTGESRFSRVTLVEQEKRNTRGIYRENVNDDVSPSPSKS